METAVQNVSEEVRKMAECFSKRKWPANYTREKIAYESYIAGAASQKPIEHTKEPKDDTRD